MDKQTKNILVVLGVIALFAYVLPNMQNPTVPSVVQTTGGTTTTDGIVIHTATPTVEWYFKDAITGASVAPGHFRVTINGSTSEQTATATANASRGAAFTICLMPNTTYYGVCQSGTVDDAVEKVTLSGYALGTATIWINNDPENAQTRNDPDASPSGVDTLAASDTDTATVCFQGATANASYGNGAILAILDFNGNSFTDASLSIPGAVECSGCIPSGYSRDGNATTQKAYEINQFLTNQTTICGSLSLTNDSTDEVGSGDWEAPRVSLYDRAYFRHSVTDQLEQAYARPTNGADTNTATNATAVSYYIN